MTIGPMPLLAKLASIKAFCGVGPGSCIVFGVLTSVHGTKRTCRAYLTMSVDGDRTEVARRPSNRRD
jgi:hypothetical protein